MTNATSPSLTTPASSINRTKYFSIELYCAGMIPLTTYDAYADGILINAFCKPHGGALGAPLTSDSTGVLRVQYHASVNYNQQFLVNPTPDKNKLLTKNTVINFVDPFNNSSIITFPILLKSGYKS